MLGSPSVGRRSQGPSVSFSTGQGFVPSSGNDRPPPCPPPSFLSVWPLCSWSHMAVVHLPPADQGSGDFPLSWVHRTGQAASLGSRGARAGLGGWLWGSLSRGAPPADSTHINAPNAGKLLEGHTGGLEPVEHLGLGFGKAADTSLPLPIAAVKPESPHRF